MCGVQGPYARRILVQELGVSESSIMRATPLPDFGGEKEPHHGHADPNLTHAHDLVDKMGLTVTGEKKNNESNKYPSFGAAWDGDADRNMILGNQFFLIPSDSLAMIVDNCDECIPYFSKNGRVKAAARSMPTSRALDVVCAKKGNIQCFETPTGWKFFGNLMESTNPVYRPFICGEEAFGTASCHAREKDGMWAVLCWLQILAVKNKENLLVSSKSESGPDTTKKLIGVSDIAEQHWKKYGRHYYARWDWEEIDSEKAKSFMVDVERRINLGVPMGPPSESETDSTSSSDHIIGKKLSVDGIDYVIQFADNFNYTDPVDGTKAEGQGLRLFFENGSRVVFRLSGTGVVGATIRVYLEKYVSAESGLPLTNNHLKEVDSFGKAVTKFVEIGKFTGLDDPTLST